MNLPFFFVEKIPVVGEETLLGEENAKHIVQSLRMGGGERILLTDGKGHAAEAEIIQAHKKKLTVASRHIHFTPRTGSDTAIAISLIKNNNRLEWFLEKAVELGIWRIIPLLCERTEKEHFRYDRFLNIAVSAMLQSRQVWLPDIQSPTAFKEAVQQSAQDQKFIAHCADERRRNLADLFNSSLKSHITLIGPEGDFTSSEIKWATDHRFDAIALGPNRLRTETAGIVAATILSVY